MLYVHSDVSRGTGRSRIPPSSLCTSQVERRHLVTWVHFHTGTHISYIFSVSNVAIVSIMSGLVTNKRAFNRAPNDYTIIRSVIGMKKGTTLALMNII